MGLQTADVCVRSELSIMMQIFSSYLYFDTVLRLTEGPY